MIPVQIYKIKVRIIKVQNYKSEIVHACKDSNVVFSKRREYLFDINLSNVTHRLYIKETVDSSMIVYHFLHHAQQFCSSWMTSRMHNEKRRG